MTDQPRVCRTRLHPARSVAHSFRATTGRGSSRPAIDPLQSVELHAPLPMALAVDRRRSRYSKVSVSSARARPAVCVRHKFLRCIVVSAILAFWGASCVEARQQPIAFVNVTVVPMNQENVLPGQTVLVVGQRVAQIGPTTSVRLPANALKIDGRGDFLMPGLADMHVHLIRSLDAIRSKKAPSVQPSSQAIPPLSASKETLKNWS
jgi:hypothetical protein